MPEFRKIWHTLRGLWNSVKYNFFHLPLYLQIMFLFLRTDPQHKRPLHFWVLCDWLVWCLNTEYKSIVLIVKRLLLVNWIHIFKVLLSEDRKFTPQLLTWRPGTRHIQNICEFSVLVAITAEVDCLGQSLLFPSPFPAFIINFVSVVLETLTVSWLA